MSISRRHTLALLGSTTLAPLAGCVTAPPLEGPADAAFQALSAQWLEDTIRLNPIGATALGDHRFDDALDDVSETGRQARRAARTATAQALAAIPQEALSSANQVDASILSNELQLQAWHDEDAQSWAWDPLAYNSLAGGALYSLMAREFAPLPERLASATARMQALPALLQQARDSLTPERVPRVHAETAIRQNPGAVSIIDEMILPQAEALGPADRTRLLAAAETAKAAIADQQRWLEETLLPNARGAFRLGESLYASKLARALNSAQSWQEIGADARESLARTQAEMYEIAAQYWSGRTGGPPTPAQPSAEEARAVIAAALEVAYAERPAREQLMDDARKTLAESTAFVRERALITLPDAPVSVIEMPVFQQGVAVAYCDPPGPLDRDQPTFYAISPIPAGWSDAQTASFLKEYNSRSLHELTVHEAMPGHYVQLWHSNRFPSTLRAVLYSGSFVEGWACYAQDMMGEEGYFGGDPLRALINKKWALRVIANAILDGQIHAGELDRDEALRFMTQDAFQEEREAAGKWIRAQVTSAQLPTYFVGWREHFALRAEALRRWGAGFSLKRYHDTVLSFGSPPARYVRSQMFGETVGQVLAEPRAN
jgi:uncharacterized protein (DUF885 family)